MTAGTCFATLPAAWPEFWREAQGAEAIRREAVVEGPDGTAETAEASFVAPRALPRLGRRGRADKGAARKDPALEAVTGARLLVIVLPMGRYDDGVWAPIIADLVAGAAGEALLAWSGIEPFLVPFGPRGETLWRDPRVAQAVLGTLAGGQRSLDALLAQGKSEPARCLAQLGGSAGTPHIRLSARA